MNSVCAIVANAQSSLLRFCGSIFDILRFKSVRDNPIEIPDPEFFVADCPRWVKQYVTIEPTLLTGQTLALFHCQNLTAYSLQPTA